LESHTGASHRQNVTQNTASPGSENSFPRYAIFMMQEQQWFWYDSSPSETFPVTPRHQSCHRAFSRFLTWTSQ
jgi:hypothetical protein